MAKRGGYEHALGVLDASCSAGIFSQFAIDGRVHVCRKKKKWEGKRTEYTRSPTAYKKNHKAGTAGGGPAPPLLCDPGWVG